VAEFLPPVVATLLADTKQFKAEMAKAEGSMTSLGRSSETFGTRAMAMGQRVSTGILAAAGGVFAAGVFEAYKYDSALRAMVDQTGMAQSELNRQKESILNIANNTGAATTDLIAGLTQLEKTGTRGAQADRLLTTAALDAAAGNASLADEITAVIALQKAGVKGSGDLSGMLALLTGTTRHTNLSLQDLSTMMGGKLVLAVSALGVPLKSILPVVGLLADAGYSGTKATMALTMGMNKMVTPSKTTAKALSVFGITQDELAMKLRSPVGLTGTLEFLARAIQKSGMSAQQATPLLMQAFGGARAGAAVAFLVQNVEKLVKLQGQIGGTTQQTIRTELAKNPEFQFHKLEQQLHTALVHLGEVGLPFVIKGITWGSRAIDDLSHSGAAQAALGTLVAGALALKVIGIGTKIAEGFGLAASGAQVAGVIGLAIGAAIASYLATQGILHKLFGGWQGQSGPPLSDYWFLHGIGKGAQTVLGWLGIHSPGPTAQLSKLGTLEANLMSWRKNLHGGMLTPAEATTLGHSIGLSSGQLVKDGILQALGGGKGKQPSAFKVTIDPQSIAALAGSQKAVVVNHKTTVTVRSR